MFKLNNNKNKGNLLHSKIFLIPTFLNKMLIFNTKTKIDFHKYQ